MPDKYMYPIFKEDIKSPADLEKALNSGKWDINEIPADNAVLAYESVRKRLERGEKTTEKDLEGIASGWGVTKKDIMKAKLDYDQFIKDQTEKPKIANTMATQAAMSSGSMPFPPIDAIKVKEETWDKLEPSQKRTVIETGIGTAGTLPFKGPLAIPMAYPAGVAGSLVSEWVDPTYGSTADVLKRAHNTGLNNVLGEAIGFGVFKGAGKVKKGIVKKITGVDEPKMVTGFDGEKIVKETGPDLDRIRRTQELVYEGGNRETPNVYQAFPTEGSHTAMSIVQGNPIVAETIAAQGERNLDTVLTKMEYFQDYIKANKKLSPEEIADVFVDSLKEGEKAFKQFSNSQYAILDKMTNPKGIRKWVVNQEGTKKIVNDLGEVEFVPNLVRRQIPWGEPGKMVSMKNLKKSAGRLQAQMKAKGTLTKEAENEFQKLFDLEDEIPFLYAHAQRSKLLRLARTPNEIVPGSAANMGGKMAKEFDRAMSVSAKKNGPEVYKQWRIANSEYKNGKAFYNDKFLKRLFNTGDVSGGRIIKSLRNLSTREIKKVKQLVSDLPDPRDRDNFMGALAADFMERARNPTTGNFSGKKLVKLINKADSEFGSANLIELMGAKNAELLRDFGHAAEMLELQAKGGKMGMLSTFAQLGAAIGIVKSGMALKFSGVAAGGVVVLTPAQVGKVLLNKKTIDNLLNAADLIKRGDYGKARTLLNRFYTATLKAGALQGDMWERLTGQKPYNSFTDAQKQMLEQQNQPPQQQVQPHQLNIQP